MDASQLQQALQDRAHLSPDQAERAAQVALEFFAEHVPGGSEVLQKGGGADAIAKNLGGLFNR
jgi:hypothetical protein